MKKNKVKEKLLEGGLVLGLIENCLTPSQAEILGLFGFDFLLFDTEHGNISDEALEQLIRAADCTDSTAFVRVQTHDEKKILRAMDLGAAGVLIPMVESRREAEECTAAARYAPMGTRGLSMSTRAARFGLDFNTKEHIKSSNEESMVLVQLESAAGFAALDEILTVEGIDVFFIGPTDLSQSMGFAGNKNAPEVQNAIKEAIEKINAAGRIAGIHTSSLEEIRRYREYGAVFFTCTSLSIYKSALKEFLGDFRTLGE